MVDGLSCSSGFLATTGYFVAAMVEGSCVGGGCEADSNAFMCEVNDSNLQVGQSTGPTFIALPLQVYTA